MCFYSTEQTPSTAASVAVKSYAVAVLIFQWVTCFMIILAEVQALSVICFIILGTGVAVFLAFWFKFKNMLYILNVEGKSVSELLLDQQYIHPLDKNNSINL